MTADLILSELGLVIADRIFSELDADYFISSESTSVSMLRFPRAAHIAAIRRLVAMLAIPMRSQSTTCILREQHAVQLEPKWLRTHTCIHAYIQLDIVTAAQTRVITSSAN